MIGDRLVLRRGRGAAFLACFAGVAGLAGLLAIPRPAAANMAQSVFIEAARSEGVLTSQSPDSIRVERIDLSLDFRRQGRGSSRAHYELESPVEADVPLTFVASAIVESVTVDGAPVPFLPTRVGGSYRLVVPEKGVYQFGNSETAEHVFTIHLAAHRHTVVDVVFAAQPGHVTRRVEDTDGLSRLVTRKTYLPTAETFDYPLWPAVGFGGGVGPISITLKTSPGARIQAAGTGLPERSSSGEEHVEVPAGDTGKGLDARLELHTVGVSYDIDLLRFTTPGASLFGSVRVSSGDEGSGRFQLRGSADVIVPGRAALTLGAESDFRGTLSGILALQHGTANGYASAYAALGTVVFLRPGAAAGLEAAAGFRAVVIPLDVALQIIPFRSAQAADVGRVRGLIGLRVGF